VIRTDYVWHILVCCSHACDGVWSKNFVSGMLFNFAAVALKLREYTALCDYLNIEITPLKFDYFIN